MKSINKITIYFLSILALGISCDSEDDLIAKRKDDNKLPVEVIETGTSGSADFTTFVSIGNSLTAGFMDGALYTGGQQNSFPNILANQFQIDGVGGGMFNQPDINSKNGFNNSFSDLNNGIISGRTELSLSLRAPVPTVGELPTAYSGDKSSLNNFGVPGIVIGQLLIPNTGTPGDPFENGLYTRFASAPGTSTILGDAIARNPTFYSLWIGSNDVLGYAVTGGNGSIGITDFGTFQANFGAIIGSLTATGAKGVVVNIPPLLLAPFFRAIPWNAIPMDAATAMDVNAAYAPYNGGLAAALGAGIISQEEHDSRVIEFAEGVNGFLIEDPELTDVATLSGGAIPIEKWRLTNASDLVPLSAGALLGKLADPNNEASVYGVGVPIGDSYLLTLAEQTEIITARATYNGIIAGVIAGANAAAGSTIIAAHDIQPLFADLAGLSSEQAALLALSMAAQDAADGTLGVTLQGFDYAPDFSPNGLFSTDGIHPNPKGHAAIANDLIGTINNEFGASIPEVDLVPFITVITTN